MDPPVAASGSPQVFGSVLDAMADGVVVAGSDGQIVYVNQQAESLTGYGAGDLVGRSIESLVPAGQRAGHQLNRARYLEHPAVRAMGRHLDIRLRRRDGSELPVDIALSPLPGPDGAQVVAVIRDVSEQRRAERALLMRSALLELSHDAVLIRRLETGTITFWNQGAVESYGFSGTSALGAAADDLLKTVYPVARRLVDAELRRSGRWEGELMHTRMDGSRVYVSSRMLVAPEDGGAERLVFQIDRDITDERTARARLAAVLELTQAILAGSEADRVLDLVARRARELVGAELATIALPEASDGNFVVRAAAGTNAERLLGMRVPRDRSIIGRTLATGQPIFVDDLASDEVAFRPFVEAAQMGPALFVPLGDQAVSPGTLMVAGPAGSARFTGGELQTLAQLFAAVAAVAVEYARAREAARRVGRMEDRERIGRALHDGAITRLFSVAISLQTASLIVGAEGARRIDEAIAEIDAVIRDMRRYVFDLFAGEAEIGGG